MGWIASLGATIVTVYVSRLIVHNFNVLGIGDLINNFIDRYVEDHDIDVDEKIKQIEMKRVEVVVDREDDSNKNEFHM